MLKFPLANRRETEVSEDGSLIFCPSSLEQKGKHLFKSITSVFLLLSREKLPKLSRERKRCQNLWRGGGRFSSLSPPHSVFFCDTLGQIQWCFVLSPNLLGLWSVFLSGFRTSRVCFLVQCLYVFLCLCFLAGMASKIVLFGVRFSGGASLFSLRLRRQIYAHPSGCSRNAPRRGVGRRSPVLSPPATAMCVNGGRRVACTRLRFHSLFLRVQVMGLFSWSRPVVGRVSGGRLSLGWCSCTARAVHAPMPASFSDNACLTFSVCLLWCFLCFFLFKSVYGFQILLVCFQGLFWPDQSSHLQKLC